MMIKETVPDEFQIVLRPVDGRNIFFNPMFYVCLWDCFAKIHIAHTATAFLCMDLVAVIRE